MLTHRDWYVPSLCPVVCSDNMFFAASTDSAFVYHEVTSGTLDYGWTQTNNTVFGVADLASQMVRSHAVELESLGVALSVCARMLLLPTKRAERATPNGVMPAAPSTIACASTRCPHHH